LDSGPNLTGALVVWTELFIETCKNCASKSENTSASLAGRV
jgi:hypothetical protein